jgi:hypothetical protein
MGLKWRKLCRWLVGGRPDPDRDLVTLIQDLVTQEVKAEFGRQRATENAIWADHFGNGAAAEPKRQVKRVMRFASGRAALSILDRRT